MSERSKGGVKGGHESQSPFLTSLYRQGWGGNQENGFYLPMIPYVNEWSHRKPSKREVVLPCRKVAKNLDRNKNLIVQLDIKEQ